MSLQGAVCLGLLGPEATMVGSLLFVRTGPSLPGLCDSLGTRPAVGLKEAGWVLGVAAICGLVLITSWPFSELAQGSQGTSAHLSV